MRASLDDRGDSVLSTERLRERIASGKVVCAQDQRSSTTPVRLGLRPGQLSRSVSIAQATVHWYLERAAAVGLSWLLPDDCDDRRLNEKLLFPARLIWPPVTLRPAADFAQIHSQLQMHRHLARSIHIVGIRNCDKLWLQETRITALPTALANR